MEHKYSCALSSIKMKWKTYGPRIQWSVVKTVTETVRSNCQLTVWKIKELGVNREMLGPTLTRDMNTEKACTKTTLCHCAAQGSCPYTYHYIQTEQDTALCAPNIVLLPYFQCLKGQRKLCQNTIISEVRGLRTDKGTDIQWASRGLKCWYRKEKHVDPQPQNTFHNLDRKLYNTWTLNCNKSHLINKLHLWFSMESPFCEGTEIWRPILSENNKNTGQLQCSK
jgi:hypothetical protein